MIYDIIAIGGAVRDFTFANFVSELARNYKIEHPVTNRVSFSGLP